MKKFGFRPLKNWQITQFFGENKACIDVATGKKVISCDGNNPPPGYKSLYGSHGHRALDLIAPRWTPIYSIYDGVVAEKLTSEVQGWGVGILHNVDGTNYLSRYWHLCAIDVDMGEKVSLGDFLGYADNTGWSAGDHLHFEIGSCNADLSNYKHLDPEQLLFPTFALDAKTRIAYIREQIATIADKLADLARNR